MTPEEMADANKGTLAALTEYKAHKSVKAARIIDFDEVRDDLGTFALLVLLSDGMQRMFFVGFDWMAKAEEQPTEGWLVIGADGQPAFSKDADFSPSFVADAEVLSVDGKDVVSREKLFVKNSQGEPVLKSTVPVVVEDVPIDAEPLQP